MRRLRLARPSEGPLRPTIALHPATMNPPETLAQPFMRSVASCQRNRRGPVPKAMSDTRTWGRFADLAPGEPLFNAPINSGLYGTFCSSLAKNLGGPYVFS